jgi:hypothetical protein
MNILLAFAPFLVFTLVDRLAGATAGPVSGAPVSLALLPRDALGREGKIKILKGSSVPLRVGVWTTLLAISAAVRFTGWCPDRNRKPGSA